METHINSSNLRTGKKPRNYSILKKSMKPLRKQRRQISIADKKQILSLVDQGIPKTLIASQFNVERTTVTNIVKIRDKIEGLADTRCLKKIKEAKIIRNSKHNGTNQAVWIWFQEFRAAYPLLPISIELVKTKAIAFHESLCPNNDFSASNGWYYKWAAQYNIRSLKCTGEKGTAPTEEVDPFIEDLLKTIRREELDLAQVYNFDETALQYRAIPSRSLVSHLEKSATTFKALKDRLTISPCYNVTGSHKLKLQVIGKSKKPRYFTSGPPDDVVYMSSANAWQTQNLFKDWFLNSFVPEVREFQEENGMSGKAILLLDNASPHTPLESEDGFIRTLQLPSNTTSSLVIRI